MYTGSEFKEKYKGPYYKFLHTETPVKIKDYNGIYIFKDLNLFFDFYKHGPLFAILDIPDEAVVYIKDNQIISTHIIITHIIKDEMNC